MACRSAGSPPTGKSRLRDAQTHQDLDVVALLWGRNEGFSPAATRLPRHCTGPFFLDPKFSALAARKVGSSVRWRLGRGAAAAFVAVVGVLAEAIFLAGVPLL